MSGLILHTGAAVLFPANDALPVVTPQLGPDEPLLDDIFVAGDATDPRIDLLVIQVTDLATGAWELQSVQGVPGPDAPTPPATPSMATAIAEMSVPAGAASWDDCSKTDVRLVAAPHGLFNGGGINHTTTWSLPTAPSSDIEILVEGLVEQVFVAAASASETLADTVQFFNTSAGLHRAQVPTIDTSTFDPTATLQLPANVVSAPTAADFNALLGVLRTFLDAANVLGLVIEA